MAETAVALTRAMRALLEAHFGLPGSSARAARLHLDDEMFFADVWKTVAALYKEVLSDDCRSATR